MHPLITSIHNPKIRNILALEKARERRQQKIFVLEGTKELFLAAEGGYNVQSVFFCPDIISSDEVLMIVKKEQLLIPVQRAVFDKIAYRESTGGVVAIAGQREHGLHLLTPGPNPLILVIESVEKPGNLGALLRTADAAALDAVIICDPSTDFYNPNVIRSSLGCVFTNQIASTTSDEAIAWLTQHNIRIFCTSLQAAHPYHKVDYTAPCAIVMGTESRGLTDAWVKQSDSNIIIPMQGRIDSMNVSTAAAVVIFEAKRQRGFT
jgi:RNA methyltransferase, TrmH family